MALLLWKCQAHNSAARQCTATSFFQPCWHLLKRNCRERCGKDLLSEEACSGCFGGLPPNAVQCARHRSKRGCWGAQCLLPSFLFPHFLTWRLSKLYFNDFVALQIRFYKTDQRLSYSQWCWDERLCHALLKQVECILKSADRWMHTISSRTPSICTKNQILPVSRFYGHLHVLWLSVCILTNWCLCLNFMSSIGYLCALAYQNGVTSYN